MSYVVTLKKKNKIRIWCAYSRDRKQVLGFYVGDRSESSAEKLYMQIKNFKIEKFCTDYWESFTITKTHRE